MNWQNFPQLVRSKLAPAEPIVEAQRLHPLAAEVQRLQLALDDAQLVIKSLRATLRAINSSTSRADQDEGQLPYYECYIDARLFGELEAAARLTLAERELLDKEQDEADKECPF